MPEVELIIKADNSQYVKSVREAQKVTQDLNDTNEIGTKQRMGFIEQEEKRLKVLTELRRKSYTNTNIEYYNKQIDESRKRIQDFEQIGTKAVKTSDSLSASIGKWALTLGGATVILKKLMDAFKDTIGGMALFNQVGAITRQVMNDIVTGASISIEKLQQVVKAQRILNELRIEESFDSVKVAKLNAEYQKLYTASIDQTLSKAEQLKNIDAALAKHNEFIDIEIKDTRKAIEAHRKLLDASPTNIKLIEQWNALRKKENDLEAQRDASTKRLNSRRSGILKDMEDEQIKIKKDALNTWLDAIEKSYQDQLDKQKEYQQSSQQLTEQYNKSIIDSLKGPEKLKAQRDYALKQLDEMKKQLEALGEITDVQKEQFRVLAENIRNAFTEAMIEYAKLTPAQKTAISDALIGGLPDLPGIQKSYIKTIEDMPQQEFSIWKLLGIDPESDEGRDEIDFLKNTTEEAADTVKSILDDLYDFKVDDAERRRDLLDTQILETQNALELETRLYEEGYANNLNAKKVELENLKKQREEALRNEEAALKKQHQFEIALLIAQQVAAIAKIIIETRKANAALLILGPAGIPMRIANLAAAAVSIAAIIAAVSQAAAAKLEKGGSGTEKGIITGKRHYQGGERFLDHVEVERGEAFGVLSRPATEKYGHIFHEMVSSFNKNEMPSFVAPAVTNSVRVDNNGPNSRLDKVIKEQRRLNESIMNQSQLYSDGNKRIIKKGNKVRIIG